MMHRPITIYAFLTSSSSLRLLLGALVIIAGYILSRDGSIGHPKLIIIHYFRRQIKAKPIRDDHFFSMPRTSYHVAAAALQNVNA